MATINALAVQLGSDDQTAAFKAKQALSQAVWHAVGADAGALAKEIAAEYAAKAEGKDEPKHSPKVRSELAQALSLVGGDAEVPALDASSKASPDREMARWSLDRIPTAASTAALILAARSDVGTEFRVGAIGSLGKRVGGPVEMNAALKELAADKELEVRIAALEALANLGAERDEPSYLTLNARIRAAMTAAEARGQEAEQERAAFLTDAVAPDALLRTLRRLRTLYQTEGERQLTAVAEWTPKLIYFGVILFAAWQVIRFYLGYFQQIDRAINFGL